MNLAHLLQRMARQSPERSAIFHGTDLVATYAQWAQRSAHLAQQFEEAGLKPGERAPLPLLGISEKEDEMHPWLTAGAKEFYFSRKLKEGWVMFVTQGEVPGPGLAKRVGFEPGFCRATLRMTTSSARVIGRS